MCSQLSLLDETFETCCSSSATYFCLWGFVAPSKTEDSLKTADVTDLDRLNASSVWSPSFATIEKNRSTVCEINCDFIVSVRASIS